MILVVIINKKTLNFQLIIYFYIIIHQESLSITKSKPFNNKKKLLKSPTFSSSFNIPKSPLISNSNLANIPSPTLHTHTPTTPTRLHLRSNNKRALMQSKRHNHMNIKDSSLDLKTTTTILRNFDRTDIVEQEGDTDFDEEKKMKKLKKTILIKYMTLIMTNPQNHSFQNQNQKDIVKLDFLLMGILNYQHLKSQ